MAANVLSGDRIRALVSVAVRVGLERRGLLAGLDPALVAQLPELSGPHAQLLSDVNELHRSGAQADGSAPLREWLATAVSLTHPRAEAEVFRQALRELTGGAPSPTPQAPQGAVDPGVVHVTTQRVGAQGIGILVEPGARERVMVNEQIVGGEGSTGIVLRGR